MEISRIIVCSKIKGLVPCIEQKLEGMEVFLSGYVFVNCTSEELKEGGKHRTDWQQAEIVVADPNLVAPLLNSAKNLKWLSSTWAGVNSIMTQDLKGNFLLTRLGGCFGELVSEYVFGHILAIERRLFVGLDDQKQRVWNPETYFPLTESPTGNQRPRKLSSLTIGLLGCGDIGSVVARTAKLGFGMNVCVYSGRGNSRSKPHVDSFLDLEGIMSHCDYIVNTLPSTPSTVGLLNDYIKRGHDVNNKKRKRPPVFINVGRGDVIDEICLLDALGDQTTLNGSTQPIFSAAVLDVFPEEPLPKTSLLWSHPRVFVTPHVSAPSLREDVAKNFVGNLVKFFNGEEMSFVVDWKKGY
mmetsp:Transcript_1529/g.1800  ORF Transcript_1529/g.1800 Transcript_1529/m.1800 type:complete len:354 (+) Transcript_1529:33-1094(+)